MGQRMIPSSAEVNRSLELMYRSAWPSMRTVLRNRQHSNPLLLRVSQAYCIAPFRLVTVGQQTDTWQNELDGASVTDPVAELMQRYSHFNLARGVKGRRGSPYWRTAHQIHERLNGTGDQYDFAWTNLVRFDYQRQRPSYEVVRAFAPLLSAELQHLSPDVVVFLTGPRYESVLDETFPGATRSLICGDFALDELACVSHPLLPVASFRTYHPGYLNRKRGMLNRMCDVIVRESIARSRDV